MTPVRKSFGSDNHAGAHPAVIRALGDVNAGDAGAYGGDPWTAQVTARLSETFGAGGGVFLVFTGTAANVLSLSLMLRPFEAVICPESAHLNTDECGAPERVTGSKLLPVRAPDGKLTPELVAARLDAPDLHRVRPRVVAISQVTEFGTCYTLAELGRLSDFCRANDLRLYIDGARLANAAATLGCTLPELAASADVLTFGGTKNGAIGAEAVVVMAADLAADLPAQRKQQMQLASKMRYLAAQFGALLDDQLWLRNARHANAMARRLAAGVSSIPGVALCQAVEANAVFAVLEASHVERLSRVWNIEVWDERKHVVRWMTAFDTSEDDVDAFVASVAAAAVTSVAG